MAAVKEFSFGAQFKEVFDDIISKQTGDIFISNDPGKIEAAAEVAAQSIRAAGASEEEVQEILSRLGVGTPRTKFTPEQLTELRRRVIANGGN